MSPDDLAAVRDAYDAFGRGDMDALEKLLHPDIEWTESFDAGEHVPVSHRMHGRGRDSGAEVDLAIWQVVSVRDGKLVRMYDFMDREEALAEAGR